MTRLSIRSAPCIGQRGTRIQTIIRELRREGGRHLVGSDEAQFVSNALSPAKTIAVELDHDDRFARVRARAGGPAVSRSARAV